ncbi:MAG: hypothetical protein IOB85_14695 [Methylobacterium sp.]|nr:hypothetical protein [Methylobacterium sp.]MCA3658946.1 hypothetical protein [Methylobacterium sp.]MCA3664276.1 hypothetical protein [Methylobacterium sp.]MCA3667497.1 hypothetical protein [Methylobacterium sp.]MCA3669635.1 hypothetical protein [Methylobacterium sp.]
MNPGSRLNTPRGFLPRQPLFRLLAINGLAGAGLGILFVIGILALDVAGIRSLLTSTGEWVTGLALLAMGSVTMFASVAMGGAIMLMRSPRNAESGGSEGGPGALVPVRVRRHSGASGPSRLWRD